MTFRELLDLDKQAPKAALPMNLRDKTVAAMTPTNHGTVSDTKVPRNHDTLPDTKIPHNHSSTAPGHDGGTGSTMVARIRRAVRRIGKEAATYRFTHEEKDVLAEVIYRQSRIGIKACENEIVRIGVNWMLEDYRVKGESSLLSLTLKALRD